MFQRKRVGTIVLGFIFGFGVVSILVDLIIAVTRYNLAPLPLYTLAFAPITEELMKFVVISLLGFLVQGTLRNSDMVRIGGAVGLGFGVIEAFQYINGGANLYLSLLRLVTALPFHITSGLLIGAMLIQKKSWLLYIAIVFHSFTNFLVSLNAYFLEIIVVFGIFVPLLFFSEDDFFIFKKLSQTLRSKHAYRLFRRKKP